jgi:hypothetical protein
MNPRGFPDPSALLCDDNLERLARSPSESVDLIYLDPPFFSNQDHEVIAFAGGSSTRPFRCPRDAGRGCDLSSRSPRPVNGGRWAG